MTYKVSSVNLMCVLNKTQTATVIALTKLGAFYSNLDVWVFPFLKSISGTIVTGTDTGAANALLSVGCVLLGEIGDAHAMGNAIVNCLRLEDSEWLLRDNKAVRAATDWTWDVAGKQLEQCSAR